MDTSTPRRVYNLRSNDRTSRVETQPIRLRKRVTSTDTAESNGQKRQRTQQSVGPAFSSPDAMIPLRNIYLAEQRPVISLPKRLANHVQEKPFGDLENLPTDAVFCIMARTPYHHLGALAMTSHSWMEAITTYANSGSLRARWLADVSDSPDVLPEGYTIRNDPFYSMGTLIKRLTFSLASGERVAFLQTFVRGAYEAGATPAGLSRMIHAFVVRPDGDIDPKIIDEIVAMYFTVIDDLKDDLSGVLVRPDSDRQLAGRENMDIMYSELETRKKTLSLFLSFGSTDPAFGLNKHFLGSLMKMFKFLHGALPTALFYLLFAPTTLHNNCEVINWHRLSQVSVTTLEDAQELKPLSRALYALLSCRNLKSAHSWTKNAIFNLMEEVTTYPTPWSMNTFVSLQVLEPELVPIGVIARMHRHHEEEAGDMICTMKMLLHRWEMDVHGVMDRVMDNIKLGLKPPQKRCLFDRCWDWHQKNIDELRARVGRFGDIRTEIESQIEFMPVLMKLL